MLTTSHKKQRAKVVMSNRVGRGHRGRVTTLPQTLSIISATSHRYDMPSGGNCFPTLTGQAIVIASSCACCSGVVG